MYWKVTGWRYVLLRCADDQLSIKAGSPADAQALARALLAGGDWLDVVPGIDSVVVRFDAGAMNATDAERRVSDVLAGGVPAIQESSQLIEIPVIYGGEFGPDLDDVCMQLNLTADEFIALHTQRDCRVEMLGFTPGFAFVGGLDERLHVARRPQPRQRVAPGSIGIADAFTGLYTLASPGGWTIVGRTPAELFKPKSAEPFVLQVGTRVRFVSIEAAGFDA
jgi:KipI family sensor histidine kinase inhibitor